MSTSSRRKAKKSVITFSLVVEAQEMIVTYQPNWMPDTGHFEFRSPHEPPRRIPISETGYRSYFAPMDEVTAADSPQDYAREVVLASLRSHQNARNDRQLPLF
ncbi:hypothetical protein [Bradyrhizobium sp. BR13661]|jgi:hypothetical protein|uniref:hypothetical protein n=1 Tax=Bradyrhizobium sp. BR13661 TaxID=2940622 RepID=UPI002474A2F3|nr:hypothetical protein [Bradyrhizobium sp. BR13661]MDH6258416.1 hypothetical protein [Bradyrhizobium sp. BR13661]